MKTRSLAAALLLPLMVACETNSDEQTGLEPDAGETAMADAGPDVFSFYLSDACRGVGFEVDGVQTSLQTEARGWVTKNEPEPEKPWCQDLTATTLDVSDADGAFRASAHLELKIEERTITVTGSSQASGTANSSGWFAQGKAGFTQLDVRGGGGGVTRVRTTVNCSGSVGNSGGALPGISVERCNGEALCGLSAAIPGLPSGWQPSDTASFEETTDSPDDVLACLRISFGAFAGGGTAQSDGQVVITVEPLP